MRRKPLIVMVAAVIIVAGAVGAWARTRSTAAAATTTTRTVAATVETLQQTVSATGTIEPKTQSNLSFAGSGTVTAVKVAVGDVVTAGEVLATIDPTNLQDALDLAQANLDSATTALTAAQATGTTTQIAAAQAQVDSATLKRSSAQTDLAGATMTSPISGTVATVNLTAGTAVSSGATGGSGGSGGSGAAGSGGSGGSGSAAGTSGTSSTSSSAQVVVISTSSWVVNAAVGSADLASVKKGLQATIAPTGATTPIFGTVTSVGVIATSGTSGSATFPVIVSVTGTPSGLYAGGSATVSIVTRQIADAVTVPTAAVRSLNGQSVVQLVKNGSSVSTPVTLGLVSGATTQITAGVSEGDQVLVEIRGFGGGVGLNGQTGGTRRQGTGTGGAGGGGGAGAGGGGAGAGGAGGGGGQGAPGAGQ